MWGHQFEQEDHLPPGWEGELTPAESRTLTPSPGTEEDAGVKGPLRFRARLSLQPRARYDIINVKTGTLHWLFSTTGAVI